MAVPETGELLFLPENPVLPSMPFSSEESLFNFTRESQNRGSSQMWDNPLESPEYFLDNDLAPSQSWIDFYQSLHSGSIQEFVVSDEPQAAAPKIEGERKKYQRFREKKFVCDECSRCFTLKQNVQQHIINYHMSGDREMKIRTSKRYKCLKCDQVFKTMELAIRHDQSKHITKSTAVKVYRCEQCNKVYVTKSQLNEHVSINHLNERPFECELCGGKFGRRGGLRRHKQMVHENQVFKCPYTDCDHPGYKCSKALTAHIRSVHTKHRPFICMLCDRSFVRKNDLRTHELTHSAPSRLKCEGCEKIFKRPTSLGAHKRRCKGKQEGAAETGKKRGGGRFKKTPMENRTRDGDDLEKDSSEDEIKKEDVADLVNSTHEITKKSRGKLIALASSQDTDPREDKAIVMKRKRGRPVRMISPFEMKRKRGRPVRKISPFEIRKRRCKRVPMKLID